MLAAGFLILFIGGGARFAVGLTLKPLVEDFGWGRSELGVAVALYQVVSAAFTFLAGRIADRTSPRLVLGAGMVVSGIGIGLMSLMSAPWHALLLYGIVFGVGSGTASVAPVGVMVTRAFPGRAGLANGVVTGGMSLGQLVMIAALAAVLVHIGWRSVFVWLGLAYLVSLPVLFAAIPRERSAQAATAARPREGLTIGQALRTRHFWMLAVIYGICGLDDFFVSTHIVALAQDRGIDAFLAGNLLAMMGLTGLIGVVAAGAWSDRSGPVWATAITFGVRIALFALVLIDQSPLSIAVFALAFGATFYVTAPLTVLFVRDGFGMRHLGAISGLITTVHQIFGGIGAYLGARIFDTAGDYDLALALMLAVSALALVLTLALRRAPMRQAPA